jgi:hypothetical protein
MSGPTLHDALRTRGLDSRKDDSGAQSGRVLTQDGRDVGRMDAHTGWCLVRLYDDDSTDDYERYVVKRARQLLAGVNRPAPAS